MHVVCTAGHVDHGKSTLVRALTGMEPDRFAEERRRGLTIDLGFAWADLGTPPRTVAFVDLPGHERFVANMLAGAGAIDLALFVVAADEGWMPQSQEHLDILDLLGVSRGVVALTKAETVDPETLDVSEALVREQLTGTAFGAVDVVPVSAVTGAGLPQLVQRLAAVLESAPPAADRGRPRLWVDRSFSIRGAGTVVTGTLAGGSVRTGDELAVLPAGRRARVRGLQSLKAQVEQAPPGSRVAINLSGLDREQVGRGDAVGIAEQWLAVTAADAWVRALPGHEIARRGAWHLHAGSGEWLVRVAPLHGRPVSGSGFVRLELGSPAPLTAGDRFVLREAGRQATLGGGVVLDPDPPRPRGRAEREARAEALRRRRDSLGDRGALLALHVAERGAADRDRAAAAVGLTGPEAAAAARTRGLLPLGPALADPTAAGRWTAAVGDALRDYHTANPVDRVAPKNLALRAAAAAGCPRYLTGPLLDALVRLRRVVAEGPGVRDPSHRVELDPAQAAARSALLAALESQPFSPPSLSTAAEESRASAPLVREMEAAGDLVRLAPDLAITAAALEQAVGRLHTVFAVEGPLTAARAKEVLSTSRKYALPLLEELDRRGRTRRRGDVRDVIG